MSWTALASWWMEEVRKDPAYEEVVTPLLLELLDPEPGSIYLDVGCGEGRVSRSVESRGARCVGIELNEALLRGSTSDSVLVGEATQLPIRSNQFDGAFMVLVLEHIRDHSAVLREAARVTKSGGCLALVINHPVWTAPGSTPITDDDDEVLWRPGLYFSDAYSQMPAGEASVVFHHRTMSSLLSEAALAGWSLERMTEQPHHQLGDQAGIPRLLGCRWQLSVRGREGALREQLLDH